MGGWGITTVILHKEKIGVQGLPEVKILGQESGLTTHLLPSVLSPSH